MFRKLFIGGNFVFLQKFKKLTGGGLEGATTHHAEARLFFFYPAYDSAEFSL
jgi:hypothetical protein